MSRSASEAERLRLHNEEFRYALKHGVTILQARQKLAQLRMTELEQRVHPPLKPALTGLCGTQSPAIGADAGEQRPHYWWQDDR